MTEARDYQAERYNRRTRALERQADALEKIADALAVTAIAHAAATQAPTVDGGKRTWTEERATDLMNSVSMAAQNLERRL